MMISKEQILESIYERKNMYIRVVGVSFDKIDLDEKEELFQDAVIKFMDLDVKLNSVEHGLRYFRKLFMSKIIDESRKRMRNRLLSLSTIENRHSNIDNEHLESLVFKDGKNPDKIMQENDRKDFEKKIIKKINEILDSMPDIQKNLIMDYFFSDNGDKLSKIALKRSIDYQLAYKKVKNGLKLIREKISEELIFIFLIFLLFGVLNRWNI